MPSIPPPNLSSPKQHPMKTELAPSTQLRKAGFGGSLIFYAAIPEYCVLLSEAWLLWAAACPIVEAREEGGKTTAIKATGEQPKLPAAGGKASAELTVPQIGVRQDDQAPVTRVRTWLWVYMPQIQAEWKVLDMEVYEGPSDLEFLGQRKLEGGALELRHRRRSEPHWLLVTEVTPEPGKVTLVARPELDTAKAGDGGLPKDLPDLNVCCSLKRSRGGFDSYPDPFPEIVGRTFIFTDNGRTFLDKTVRHKLPKAADDDPRNNPPWIQDYSPVWLPVKKPVIGDTWYNCSPDRYTLPVIGVISRDGKHLVALASDTSDRLCQAWAPCIHNYPPWLPSNAPPAERRWRLTLYIMPNDPGTLLARVAKDFPAALKLQENRVPATAPSTPAQAQAQNARHSAVIPTPRMTEEYSANRHKEFLALAKKGGIDVLFLGDSITEGWLRQGQVAWKKHFEPLKAANFSVSRDRTEHVLWRLQNGELEGIGPKVAVLEIGTNNMIHNSAEEIADGIKAIVQEIRDRRPHTKVLLLGIFPRILKQGVPSLQDDPPLRVKIREVNAIVARLDNSETIRYLDIGDKFLGKDGGISKDFMFDYLHLSASGYEIWAEAITPMLENLLRR